jgi:lipoprotein-anchoring transpeptidase ErfK/SrfK
MMTLTLMRITVTALALVIGMTTAALDATAAARRKSGSTDTKPQKGISRPIVSFDPQYEVGSIIVVNQTRKLYYIVAKGQAMIYPVAVGTKDSQWTGKLFVQSKAVNPTWTPPWSPGKTVAGGGNNPLGARALYLGWTTYRIHGTNAPGSIGSAASHGCFRMLNEHVKDLYPRVHIGAPVFVVNQLASLE